MKNEFIYFTNHSCNVDRALLPKIQKHIATKYPLMDFVMVQVEDEPEKAAQLGVFTVPALLVVFEGKESFRFVRNFSTRELDDKVERLYNLLFS